MKLEIVARARHGRKRSRVLKGERMKIVMTLPDAQYQSVSNPQFTGSV